MGGVAGVDIVRRVNPEMRAILRRETRQHLDGFTKRGPLGDGSQTQAEVSNRAVQPEITQSP